MARLRAQGLRFRDQVEEPKDLAWLVMAWQCVSERAGERERERERERESKMYKDHVLMYMTTRTHTHANTHPHTWPSLTSRRAARSADRRAALRSSFALSASTRRFASPSALASEATCSGRGEGVRTLATQGLGVRTFASAAGCMCVRECAHAGLSISLPL